MPRKKAATIPPHAMAIFVAQCIASGLTPREFGRKNGLTLDQSNRLNRLVREQTAAATTRFNAAASIVPTNASQSLQRLSNRMVNGILNSGTRAIEKLEALNARYAMRPENDEPGAPVISPDISGDDLRQWKWAYGVCLNIVTLARRDGRDQPTEEQDPMKDVAPPAEPVQRAPEDKIVHHGMLTVVREAETVVSEGAMSD